MLLESFRTISLAVLQIFLLGLVGYILVKKSVLGENCLVTLSRLTMEVTLPAMIFCQLIKEFSFSAYPDWWIFPLMSIGITVLGLGIGALFLKFVPGHEHKMQFLSLVGFQNSGFLPIALIAALLPLGIAGLMFIYLFLFLLGFNLVLFSLGVFMLNHNQEKKFKFLSLFSPPVIATLVSFIFIFFGLAKQVPGVIFNPLKTLGDCTLPLSMLVVGGNLAQIHLGKVDKKAISLACLVKLIILPAIGIFLTVKFKLPYLFGLLLVMQLAVPSATTSSIIVRQYKKEDLIVSQGVFFTHILSIITIPIFLSLYLAFGSFNK